MSNFEVEDIDRSICIIPIEIVVRDQTPKTINNEEYNIITLIVLE